MAATHGSKKAKKTKPTRSASLKAGRPPTASQPRASISSKATQKTIVTFHNLNKELEKAKAHDNAALARELETQIRELGGLHAYQKASIQGQAVDRGGDSSRVLLTWLEELKEEEEEAEEEEGGGGAGDDSHNRAQGHDGLDTCTRKRRMMQRQRTQHERRKRQFRMLEVGALSTHNACSRSRLFRSIERIDLHSQAAGILSQDFMQRPLPRSGQKRDNAAAAAAAAGEATEEGEEQQQQEEEEHNDGEEEGKFDVISLSLVLNFVPDASARGEMLRRTTAFLHPAALAADAATTPKDPTAAATAATGGYLFLVLPAPCVLNSRYFDLERLRQLMACLGYTAVRTKQTAKLYYWLWQLQESPPSSASSSSSLSSSSSSSSFSSSLANVTSPDEEEKWFPKRKIRDGRGMNNFHVVLLGRKRKESKEG